MESRESTAKTTASPDAEPAAPIPMYSAFGPWQKRWIVFLAAFAAMFSPMSSFIFYPVIESIATSLSVTVGLVNLAVTTYMVVSGIVPALLGNAADKFGRRPIYLIALSVYFAANLGLALQNSYVGLLLLRMLQSAGSSGSPTRLHQLWFSADTLSRARNYFSWLRRAVRYYYPCRERFVCWASSTRVSRSIQGIGARLDCH